MNNNPTFSQLWQIYPNKKARVVAEKKFNKLNMDWDLYNLILKDIQRRLECNEWRLAEKTYIPHLSTYLNQERYRDSEEEDNFEELEQQDIVSKHMNDTEWAK